ncbi:MAG: hypothetical protein GTO02_01675, partial [Candidatus Dadabacteria bacterium]|nr:hypothetical protein [Candidatus Dadabacteria bacterium]
IMNNRSILLRVYILLPVFLSVSIGAKADHITGQIEFTKKPPYAGILYMEDSAASIQSAEIGQKDKKFDKRIVVTSPDTSLKFTNSDP